MTLLSGLLLHSWTAHRPPQKQLGCPAALFPRRPLWSCHRHRNRRTRLPGRRNRGHVHVLRAFASRRGATALALHAHLRRLHCKGPPCPRGPGKRNRCSSVKWRGATSRLPLGTHPVGSLVTCAAFCLRCHEARTTPVPCAKPCPSERTLNLAHLKQCGRRAGAARTSCLATFSARVGAAE